MASQPLLRRSSSDKVIAGVAGGLGRYLGIDPVLLRIAFVILAFTGSGLVIYAIAWLVMPLEAAGEEPPAAASLAENAGLIKVLVGTGLIAVGSAALLDQIFPWFNRILWPAVVIMIGVAVLTFGSRR